jgi:O-antigen ligase
LLFIAFNFLYFNPFKIQKIETLKIRDLKITDNYNERNILTIRLAKWDAHLLVIRDHLPWGTTEGDIRQLRQEAYKKKNFKDLVLHNYNAHNQFIEILAMFGIPGFLLFAGMLLLPFYKIEYLRAYSFFIIITSTTFLTESVLQRQQGLNYFMFFYAFYTLPRSVKKDS